MREREGRGRRVVPTALKLLRRERRDGAKQGILKRNKGRGRKSDKTVPDCLRVAGISFFFYDATPPLLQYNWTKTKTN